MTADLAHCRNLLRGGSRSFHAASLALPRHVRDPATALYAFCRLADDAIDSGSNSPAALERLHRKLDGIYRGAPDDTPVDRAFAAVVAQFAIPRALPEALLEGFQWDAEGRRYETLEELCAYAARVAGSVGVMMALLMGRRDPDVLARASELGIAMQLSNIARDIGEDARAGRVYLPLRWLRAVRIEADSFVRNPAFDPILGSLVQRLLRIAQILYDRSSIGIAHLPGLCRPGMHAARLLYSEIGNEVARRGFDSVSQRAVVSPARKLRLMPGALAASLAASQPLQIPVLPEAKFLIDAVGPGSCQIETLQSHEAVPAWWDFGGRVVRLIDLFERLERREQLKRINP